MPGGDDGQIRGLGCSNGEEAVHDAEDGAEKADKRRDRADRGQKPAARTQLSGCACLDPVQPQLQPLAQRGAEVGGKDWRKLRQLLAQGLRGQGKGAAAGKRDKTGFRRHPGMSPPQPQEGKGEFHHLEQEDGQDGSHGQGQRRHHRLDDRVRPGDKADKVGLDRNVHSVARGLRHVPAARQDRRRLAFGRNLAQNRRLAGHQGRHAVLRRCRAGQAQRTGQAQRDSPDKDPYHVRLFPTESLAFIPAALSSDRLLR